MGGGVAECLPWRLPEAEGDALGGKGEAMEGGHSLIAGRVTLETGEGVG
jgi:hypothetical protein